MVKRCVICGEEKEETYFIGNVCKLCFHAKGIHICCICGKPLEENENFEEYWDIGYTENLTIPGRVCKDCVNNMVRCRDCGSLMFPDQGYTYYELGTGRATDERICPECYENYIECNHCRGLIDTETDQFYRDVDGFTVCETCKYYYVFCEECERLVHIDEAFYDSDSDYYYCRSCARFFDVDDDEDEIVINNYGYKPQPIFHLFASEHLGERFQKEPLLFLGVELEIDEGGTDIDNARYILSGCNYPGFLYAKHDGSLIDGFEIVSHPATLAFHLIEVGWDEVLKRAERKGFTSHDNKRCGLHIHINKNFWGKDENTQEIGELKLLIFFERFWDEIVRFSRRTSSQILHYCARYQTVNLQEAKRENGEKRYYAINFQNKNTIEFRIFRGTLRLLTFYATLEFVYHLCHFLREKNTKELQKSTWASFVDSIPEWMVELKQYLKERNLA
jgi:hypothetical protein